MYCMYSIVCTVQHTIVYAVLAIALENAGVASKPGRVVWLEESRIIDITGRSDA